MIQSHRDALAFSPELANLLDTQRLTGRTGKVFANLAARSTFNNLIVLRNLHRAFQPEHTLEIGLCFGTSCLALTATHRELGAAPACQHVALDPFQSTVWDGAGIAAVERAGLSGYVDVREMFSCLALPALVQEGRRFGLIYVDGSHLFEDVFVDFYFSAELLTPGGILLFDDSSDPHVRKVLRFLTTNAVTSLEPLDLAPYRLDRGVDLKYRAGSWLGRNQLTAFRKIGPARREWDTRFRNF